MLVGLFHAKDAEQLASGTGPSTSGRPVGMTSSTTWDHAAGAKARDGYPMDPVGPAVGLARPHVLTARRDLFQRVLPAELCSAGHAGVGGGVGTVGGRRRGLRRRPAEARRWGLEPVGRRPRQGPRRPLSGRW